MRIAARTLVAVVLPLVGMTTTPTAATPLSSWTELDAWVAEQRTCYSLSGALYPTFMPPMTHDAGIVLFDPDAFPDLLSLPATNRMGYAARTVTVDELPATPRLWVLSDDSGTAFRTNNVPLGYDVEQWIADEYGEPPGWLAGTNLVAWYADRDPSRITLRTMFMTSADHAAMLDALQLCNTNPPAGEAALVIPADTNALGVARIDSVGGNGMSGWLYSPDPAKPAGLFRARALGGAWEFAAEYSGNDGFLPWSDSLGWSDSTFYCFADTTNDDDNDGVPTAIEQFVYGSSPYYQDTDGDGVADFLEANTHGSSTTLADTDGDGLSDLLELQLGTSLTETDTDGDGLTDWEEVVVYRTNPTDPDTDNDDLTDLAEVRTHGTSPFHTDTEGDGLGDGREIVALGSNALAWDTDDDGIDDDTEYSGRSTGLDLLDPTDAAQDSDEDGFSDLAEFTWGRGRLTAASTYEVPKFRLVHVSAGQHPHRRSTGDGGYGYRIIVLGDHTNLSAKVRVPRSTQIASTNVVKRLYFTHAPGILLNGTALDGATSPWLIDDANGNVEYKVTARPSAQGTTAQLWLGNDQGLTNIWPLVVAVPAFTKVKLEVSNVSSLTSSTNLVPGITGTLCVPADDPLFGLPRVTLIPTITPSGPGDGPLLWNTDLVLARISGATNETRTVNWKRWDSAHNTRHGFALPHGVSRVEAGFDFDFDGQLDNDEVAVACDIHVVRLRLEVDADRDDAIGDDDRPHRAEWRHWNGALMAVDDCGPESRGFRCSASSPLAKLRVAELGCELPADYTVALHAEQSPSTLRLYPLGGTNALPFVAHTATQGMEQAAHGPLSFFASTTVGAAHAATEPERELHWQLKRGVTVVGSDTVRLKTAPIIVPWNTLPVVRLYTSWTSDIWHFPTNVVPGRQYAIPNATCQWAQDMVQAGAFQLAAGDWRPLVADLGRPAAQDFVSALVYAAGVWDQRVLSSVDWSNTPAGNGGNIEATPPLPDYPYGRLLAGVRVPDAVDATMHKLEAQGLQGPAIQIPVDWLEVGHVDEVFCFVESRKVLVPSPRLAYNLIAEQVFAHGGNYTNTCVWGTDPADYIRPMQSIVFDRVVTNALWQTPLAAEAISTVTGFDHGYQAGDLLACGTEIMHVRAITRSPPNATLALDRGQASTQASPHAANAVLAWLSEVTTANLVNVNNQVAVENRIEDCRTRIKSFIGDISLVEVPVLFSCWMNGNVRIGVAGTANLVNAVVDGQTVYMTDPGCELFRAAVPLPGATFVGGSMVWERYHCMMGELHCGSEAERYIPPLKPWWERPEFKDWPHVKKGVTP